MNYNVIMNCNDCIHKNVCYKVDYVNNTTTCGDFFTHMILAEILDKIKVEIEECKQKMWKYPMGNTGMVACDKCSKIIDKYKDKVIK